MIISELYLTVKDFLELIDGNNLYGMSVLFNGPFVIHGDDE